MYLTASGIILAWLGPFWWLSGIILAWLGPFWWLNSPVGQVLKGTH